MITVKTKVQPIIIERQTQAITKKNGWFARKFLGSPKEEVICEIHGPLTIPPFKIKITDEIDVHDWFEQTKYIGFTPGLDTPLPYKKTLKVTTTRGEVYELYGAFPIGIDSDIVKISIDKAILVSVDNER